MQLWRLKHFAHDCLHIDSQDVARLEGDNYDVASMQAGMQAGRQAGRPSVQYLPVVLKLLMKAPASGGKHESNGRRH